MTTAPPAEAAKTAALLSPSPTSAPRPTAPAAPPVRRVPLVVSGLLGAALTAYVWAAHGAKPGVLLLLGLALGVALFHSRFGFTSAWRQLVAVGNGTGLRAHALLLGTTATLFALLIGTKTGLFGSVPAPSAGPLGLGLLIGSFVFAVGMQLGGACASGTLFAVGSGQTSILLTLGGFIAGATLAAWQFDLWKDLPALEPVVMADHIGWFGSWAVTILALAAIVLVSRRVQARRNPPPIGPVPSARGAAARVLRGSWPLAVGALALAVLGAGVLLVSGGAWGVTSAFSLWGAELVRALGGHPESWSWWQQPGNKEMLAGPVLADKTSLTDIGIMIGAAVAAALGGTWTLHRGVPWRTATAAVLGGALMGIGARLAGGCNIGAYLAGIASGSLHGWIWGASALLGTWAGLRLRPLFGLGNPKPGDGVC
ncbi:YeeE/YedE family protein [Streptomyces hygroscopicus subsp. hygroscopicus]|uniref:Membrane protein YedE/YeeE n=1 Tax=Streptomyces demainii TaxID=588122 RepID=A0ABT9L4J6_9ACTN|nr:MULTISPECIES: YeeE/YedE family protein [Streptomyces]MBW8091486.1 YeeE/YedE family protein [Streptomyces hygroscopicus subsp. hygroscopicus]MDP9615626.1 putative membrane protein YedE/YeeE [Streptomyces demainii]